MSIDENAFEQSIKGRDISWSSMQKRRKIIEEYEAAKASSCARPQYDNSEEKQIAFQRVMGDPSMPDDAAPDYDEWLFNKAWEAAKAPATDQPDNIGQESEHYGENLYDDMVKHGILPDTDQPVGISLVEELESLFCEPVNTERGSAGYWTNFGISLAIEIARKREQVAQGKPEIRDALECAERLADDKGSDLQYEIIAKGVLALSSTEREAVIDDESEAELRATAHYEDGIKLRRRLAKAIGGLRSIAYGDAQTWPNCSSREVAKQALLDCGGEKNVEGVSTAQLPMVSGIDHSADESRASPEQPRRGPVNEPESVPANTIRTCQCNDCIAIRKANGIEVEAAT